MSLQYSHRDAGFSPRVGCGIAGSSRSRSVVLALALVVGGLMVGGTANAATTFTGAVDNTWEDAGNWSAGFPDAADDTAFNTAATLTSTATVRRLLLQGAGDILTIDAGGDLTGVASVGFINTSAQLIVNNGGSYTRAGTLDIRNGGGGITINDGGFFSLGNLRAADGTFAINGSTADVTINNITTVDPATGDGNNNTFTPNNANLTLNGATLNVTGLMQWDGASAISVGAGSTLNFSGANEDHVLTDGLALTGGGQLNLTGGGTITGDVSMDASSTITYTGSTTQRVDLNTGSGTLIVDGSGSLSADDGSGGGNAEWLSVDTIDMRSGTLGATRNLFADQILMTGGTMNNTGVRLRLFGSGALANSTMSAGTIDNTGRDFELGNTGTPVFTMTGGNVITGGLRMGGTAGGRNGTLNLEGGVLTTGSVFDPGAGTSTFNFDGGTLQTSQDNATFMTGLDSANVLGGGAIIDSNNFDITIGQDLLDGGGGGGLTKNSAGTLTLTGTNTYTGATTINAGTLALSNGAAITDTGDVVIADVVGATLQLNASETIGSLAGGGVSGGEVNLGASTLTIADSAGEDFAGTISGGGSLIKTASGTQILSGSNSYTGGTTLSAGTLVLEDTSALGTGTLTLSGGILAENLAGNNTYANDIVATAATSTAIIDTSGGNFDLSGTLSGSGILNFGGTGDGQVAANVRNFGSWSGGFSGTITHESVVGGNTLFLASLNAPALKLATSGSTSGAYTRFAGTSTVGELSGTGGIIRGRNGSLTVNQGTNTTYSGHLADEGTRTLTFVKDGSGTLTLDFANTYTGTTTVEAGTLLVNGDNSGATGDVTVNAGATLGGSGTIGDLTTTTTIASGAFLSPGASAGAIGTLNIGGNLDLSSISPGALLFDLDPGVGPPGTGDLVNVAGTLDIGVSLLEWDDFTFTTTGLGLTAADEGEPAYELFSSANPITGSLGAGVFGVLDGLFARLRLDGNSIFLDLDADAPFPGDPNFNPFDFVPEPSRAMLLLFGFCAAFLRRRRS